MRRVITAERGYSGAARASWLTGSSSQLRLDGRGSACAHRPIGAGLRFQLPNARTASGLEHARPSGFSEALAPMDRWFGRHHPALNMRLTAYRTFRGLSRLSAPVALDRRRTLVAAFESGAGAVVNNDLDSRGGPYDYALVVPR